MVPGYDFLALNRLATKFTPTSTFTRKLPTVSCPLKGIMSRQSFFLSWLKIWQLATWCTQRWEVWTPSTGKYGLPQREVWTPSSGKHELPQTGSMASLKREVWTPSNRKYGLPQTGNMDSPSGKHGLLNGKYGLPQREVWTPPRFQRLNNIWLAKDLVNFQWRATIPFIRKLNLFKFSLCVTASLHE